VEKCLIGYFRTDINDDLVDYIYDKKEILIIITSREDKTYSVENIRLSYFQ
jgi:hypothetical protein